MRNIEKILIRLPNWLGDIVMVTPLLLATIREKKDAKIDLALRKNLFELVENFPHINRFYLIEGKTLSSTFKYLKEIRNEKYDHYIVCPKGFREGIVALFSNSKSTIGFDVNGRRPLFSKPVLLTKELWMKHHTLQFAELFKEINVKLCDEKTFLPISKEDENNALTIMERYGIIPYQFITFHIGASKPERALHPQKFATIAKKLSEKTDLKIVLIGSKEEKPFIDDFKKYFSNFIDFSSKLDLKTLKPFLSYSKLFIGNDSGPMHIASAVKTKVVAIFGPGSPEKTAPFMNKENLLIIYSKLSCSPCRQSFFKDCKPSANNKPPCLEVLNPEDIANSILEFLLSEES